MDLESLRKDSLVSEWIDSFGRKNTALSYLQGLKLFTEFTGKSPESLIIEAEEEIKSGKLMRQRSIKRYLTGFKKALQDQNAAEFTIKNSLGGLQNFEKLAISQKLIVVWFTESMGKILEPF